MPNTYVALRTETVAVATPSVTFDLTGISGYTDLVIVSNLRYSAGSPTGNAYFRFNSDSGTNYSRTFLQGDGTSATSGRASNENGLYVLGNTPTTSVFTTNITQIQNYSNTITFKTALNRWSNAGDFALAFVGLWRNTAAITSIDIFASGTTNFAIGSTFSLYGIANADQGAAKATGGIITEDSQYWYHTFGASGAFIPKQSLTCDYLVVAGGGSGGGSSNANGGAGGGGGAGSLIAATSVTLSPGTYNAVIGGGGAQVLTINVDGNNGTNSSFNSSVATGGGGGGGFQRNGLNGGSGGGAGGINSGSRTGGTGTTGGNAGGNSTSTSFECGGGGGAGAVGAGSSTGSTGGVGSLTYSSWGAATGVGQNVSGTYYLAGGGGGGRNSDIAIGGFGGGGAGGKNAAPKANAVAGTVNTGGGGGGGRDSDSQAGGSGVVIVRYSK